jgi:prepilin-type N-terminal cleavage/methylation domain-containing protein
LKSSDPFRSRDVRRAQKQPTGALSSSRSKRRAFTIVELLVSLSIIALLTGIMMPGLRAARDGANRMVCTSNLRQMGLALYGYSALYGDQLPSTIFDDDSTLAPQEMMALNTGHLPTSNSVPQADGLGWLISPEVQLIEDPRILYCPCHRGGHAVSRYEGQWQPTSPERIYCNYHYIGDNDRGLHSQRRLFLFAPETAIIVDGMRDRSDLNHRNGTNALRADLSARFWHDRQFRLRDSINMADGDTPASEQVYGELWKLFAITD